MLEDEVDCDLRILVDLLQMLFYEKTVCIRKMHLNHVHVVGSKFPRVVNDAVAVFVDWFLIDSFQSKCENE